MMAYYNAQNGIGKLTYEWIEHFIKKKTHRNILDQEKGFIEEVWQLASHCDAMRC